jgi:hypothetical protein
LTNASMLACLRKRLNIPRFLLSRHRTIHSCSICQ